MIIMENKKRQNIIIIVNNRPPRIQRGKNFHPHGERKEFGRLSQDQDPV
jgi:hypothetical protein